ncbi:hypothetical protein NPIL_619531 [Nephila pilipes]|uniref:Uncharacterized protein n=1 Tax=Nephila pilipes TaxID=299642 RepID=A0A8X6TLW8_NEPPI|nr:hypothetical protein NPIL_619531 [Nephila pilipes]
MGCANSKTGATGAYGAPEEEAAGAPPKVMVDGEGQDGAVAANGNAVSCANGGEAEDTAGEEKEACNGDANNDESDGAPSSGEKTEQNGGCGEDNDKSIQDGGGEQAAADEENKADDSKEEKNSEDATESSENAESRENNDEEKPE